MYNLIDANNSNPYFENSHQIFDHAVLVSRELDDCRKNESINVHQRTGALVVALLKEKHFKQINKLSRSGGQVVSVLAFYSSSNPAEV